MLPPRAIARIDAPSERVFREKYLRPGVPVVLRGLIDDWPALRTWSTTYLRERYGEARLPTLTLVDGVARAARRGLVTTPTRFQEVLDDMDAGVSRKYLMARVDALPASMQADLRDFRYCQKAAWRQAKLWCSGPQTRSALHFDVNDNLLAIISGRKRFALFSPADTPNLYPGGLLAGVANASQVDFDAIDELRFPRTSIAQPWVCVLEPGETLFLPRRWWHHVASTESTMSLNTWWSTNLRLMLNAAAGAFNLLYSVSR